MDPLIEAIAIQDYIIGWLKQFAQALERSEIVTRYESLRARVER